jgi:hypothetical protein
VGMGSQNPDAPPERGRDRRHAGSDMPGNSAQRFDKIRQYTMTRLAIFVGKKHKHSRGYGWSAVAPPRQPLHRHRPTRERGRSQRRGRRQRHPFEVGDVQGPAPQPVIDPGQHPHRITQPPGALAQRRPGIEHLPCGVHPDDPGMTRMPVAGQPPHVPQQHRPHRPDPPEPPPDLLARTPGDLERGRVTLLDPIVGAYVDHQPGPVLQPGEVVRHMPAPCSRPAPPGHTERLRANRNHARVEVQQHQLTC